MLTFYIVKICFYVTFHRKEKTIVLEKNIKDIKSLYWSKFARKS